MLLTGLVGLEPMLGYGLYGTMDNWIASVYAVVGLVGCFGFTKYWQRKTRDLAYRWNTEAAGTVEVERYDFRFDAHDEASGEPREPPPSLRRSPSDRGGIYSNDDYFIPTGGTAAVASEEPPPSAGHVFDRDSRSRRVFVSWIVVAVYVTVSFGIMLLILSFRAYPVSYTHLTLPTILLV